MARTPRIPFPERGRLLRHVSVVSAVQAVNSIILAGAVETALTRRPKDRAGRRVAGWRVPKVSDLLGGPGAKASGEAVSGDAP
jgi:hypothetical protein